LKMPTSTIKAVAVYGSGLMGRGIAQVTAAAGYSVTICDIEMPLLSRSLTSITDSLEKLARKKFTTDEAAGRNYVNDIMSRIKVTTRDEDAVKLADLVIEAVVENLDEKRKLFSKLDKMAGLDTIFVSNTSSLSIAKMAEVTKRSNLFAGLHFFNPVPMMRLVEIVRTDYTNEETIAVLKEFAQSIGKTAVECKDTPGFIVNRLLLPYLIEAIRLVEREDATPRDIDNAMRLGAGYPMGPFELLDYIGLDTVKFVLDQWHKEHPNEAMFKPSEKLNELVLTGCLGKKTGKGFYFYDDKGSKL